MDDIKRMERRKQATLARRHIYTQTSAPETFITSLSEEARENFFASERKRIALSLRRRKIKGGVLTGLGLFVAIFISALALIPIFFTFLNSFMSSEEIVANYQVVFQSMSGHASQGATYMSRTPVLKLIPEEVTIQQYSTLLFMNPEYLFKYWNSILLTLPIVAGQMVVSCLASYSFARYRRKRREVLFFSYIILMLMPFQVTLVPNYMIADSLNILDTIWAIILPGVFSTFAIFLLTKYMRQIPSGYIEAATLDGASEWQIFTNVALPLCKNAIFALTILLFIDYWNMVEQPLVLLTDINKQPLSVFLSQINEPELGIAFAASSVYMIPPLLIFFWGEDYLVEGISRSGIK
ncbi:MAG: carbohydrate ABC transporter permease [Saccharofermentans sp.]|nr:carbohydrate ABC transporter permease [Saccharofermentans sp.]